MSKKRGRDEEGNNQNDLTSDDEFEDPEKISRRGNKTFALLDLTSGDEFEDPDKPTVPNSVVPIELPPFVLPNSAAGTVAVSAPPNSVVPIEFPPFVLPNSAAGSVAVSAPRNSVAGPVAVSAPPNSATGPNKQVGVDGVTNRTTDGQSPGLSENDFEGVPDSATSPLGDQTDVPADEGEQHVDDERKDEEEEKHKEEDNVPPIPDACEQNPDTAWIPLPALDSIEDGKYTYIIQLLTDLPDWTTRDARETLAFAVQTSGSLSAFPEEIAELLGYQPSSNVRKLYRGDGTTLNLDDDGYIAGLLTWGNRDDDTRKVMLQCVNMILNKRAAQFTRERRNVNCTTSSWVPGLAAAYRRWHPLPQEFEPYLTSSPFPVQGNFMLFNIPQYNADVLARKMATTTSPARLVAMQREFRRKEIRETHVQFVMHVFNTAKHLRESFDRDVTHNREIDVYDLYNSKNALLMFISAVTRNEAIPEDLSVYGTIPGEGPIQDAGCKPPGGGAGGPPAWSDVSIDASENPDADFREEHLTSKAAKDLYKDGPQSPDAVQNFVAAMTQSGLGIRSVAKKIRAWLGISPVPRAANLINPIDKTVDVSETGYVFLLMAWGGQNPDRFRDVVFGLFNSMGVQLDALARRNSARNCSVIVNVAERAANLMRAKSLTPYFLPYGLRTPTVDAEQLFHVNVPRFDASVLNSIPEPRTRPMQRAWKVKILHKTLWVWVANFYEVLKDANEKLREPKLNFFFQYFQAQQNQNSLAKWLIS